MKKYLAILVAIILIVSACACLSACEKDEITLYVPDGAPALSVAKIIYDGKVGNDKVNTLISTGEDVVAKCSSGEADMAVLPTNAAVKICTSRSDYLMFSVNVYGVLYIVGTEHIDSIADLQGQTLYSIGLGNTPQYVFETICDAQSVKYVGENAIDVQYQTDASTIIPQILKGSAKFALIGEPAVTQLKNKAASQGKTVETLFDLQQLWQQATGSEQTGYPQASMIVKKSLLTDEFATKLLAALQANGEFVNNNCDKLNGIMKGAHSSLDINYTADLLERCNLTAIPASLAISDLNTYLQKFAALANLLPISNDIVYEAKD